MYDAAGVDQAGPTSHAEVLKEWCKAKNFSSFILLGHSFGGYVAAKYALKHPEHVQQLILVGPAGFSSETEHMSKRMTQFRATWKGVVLNHLWETNFTPMKLISLMPTAVYDSSLLCSPSSNDMIIWRAYCTLTANALPGFQCFSRNACLRIDFSLFKAAPCSCPGSFPGLRFELDSNGDDLTEEWSGLLSGCCVHCINCECHICIRSDPTSPESEGLNYYETEITRPSNFHVLDDPQVELDASILRYIQELDLSGATIPIYSHVYSSKVDSSAFQSLEDPRDLWCHEVESIFSGCLEDIQTTTVELIVSLGWCTSESSLQPKCMQSIIVSMKSKVVEGGGPRGTKTGNSYFPEIIPPGRSNAHGNSLFLPKDNMEGTLLIYRELRELKAEEFINLRQCRMIVKKYDLKFHQLSHLLQTLASKGATSNSSTGTGWNRLYALTTQQDSEESPNVISGIAPNMEIDVGIDLVLDTHPISIPPYRMDPTELKELKEQLKDLLYKCFISPTTLKNQWLYAKFSEFWLKAVNFRGRVDKKKRDLVKDIHQLANL
ncbi:putative pentatricopeptide repeat-containing protein, mitochondrial-like [Capsicum annuum]|nr:putative pentatricopeptide repeat-containing protein, mitochondrial-like [Capsicum annuum]KAF3681590.1 putative pentatricopeptide repeat-containing protein, mitochondrial-like [Capsicum annuum]